LVPPLPLARELKVVPKYAHEGGAHIQGETPSVSWLGEELPRRGLPNPPGNRAIHRLISGVRRIAFALQSRGGDGFTPSSRARSLGWLFTAFHQRTPLAKRLFLVPLMQLKIQKSDALSRRTASRRAVGHLPSIQCQAALRILLPEARDRKLPLAYRCASTSPYAAV
jgi:hypothetical protein